MESHECMAQPAMQIVHTLANHTASSAMAGPDVATSSSMVETLRSLCVASVKGNEVAYAEALHVYATAGGSVSRAAGIIKKNTKKRKDENRRTISRPNETTKEHLIEEI
jgi:hypothetical protein